MQFLVVLKNVAILVALMIPGFILVKTKLVKENATGVLTVILLYITQPFVTANSFLSNTFSAEIMWNILTVFLFVLVLMLVMAVISHFTYFKDKLTAPDKQKVYTFAATFGNIGYMCIPLLMVMMPGNQELILYAAVSMVIFNLLAWTVGCYILTGEKKFISLKKAIFNSPTIAFFVVFPLYILNINYETSAFLGSLASTIDMCAGMTTPLAMILIGMKLAAVKPKEFFGDYRVYVSCALKLIVCPLIAFGMIAVMDTFMDTSGIRLNLIALAAMPTATNTVMFSEHFGGDTASGTKAVLMSTILSVGTIPLCLWLLV